MHFFFFLRQYLDVSHQDQSAPMVAGRQDLVAVGAHDINIAEGIGRLQAGFVVRYGRVGLQARLAAAAIRTLRI